ncbi:MAG: hypothetical protein H0V17_13970 [Deltaproteobacteria bacterium]|nr:hypothetical protein [Deltaproteobacteria bacterium]
MNNTNIRIELVRTGLLNVQHWFDHGAELLSHGPLGDWQTLVIMVEKHLIAVNAALRDGLEAAHLGIQLDATIKATNGFWHAALAWCTRNRVKMDRTLERAMDRIYEKIDQARWLLDPPEVIELTHAKAVLVDDIYEAMAAVPVFELVRYEAEAALVELGGKDAHVTAIVDRVSRELEVRIDHAAFLVEAYSGDPARFTPMVEAAVTAIDLLQKGIGARGKPPHHERLDRAIVRLVALTMKRAA